MAKWHKLFALPRVERALLIEASLRLLQAWALLRLRPFKAVAATLDREPRPAAGPPDIAAISRAVTRAARHLPLGLTCLPQAFAAAWMVRARGGRPRLHYGVAKTAEGFESHAWVELDGMPVLGHRVAGRFTKLATFPAPEDTDA